MNFGQFFGDDEHTAADGVYVRLLKSRKWLYIGAAIVALHCHRLISYPKITSLTGGLVTIPETIAGVAAIFGLLLLVFQYSLLLLQASFAYPIALKDRLFRNRNEQFEELEETSSENRERRREIAEQLYELRENSVTNAALLISMEEKHEGLEDFLYLTRPNGMEELERAQQLAALMSPRELDDAITAARGSMDKYMQEASGLEASLAAASEQVRLTAAKQKQLINETPERRKIFIASEVTLDAIRILPPILFAAYSISISAKFFYK